MVLKDYRLKGIAIAILLYGFFSQPTPEAISWAEITIMLLILLSIKVRLSIVRTLSTLHKTSFESVSILALLVWPFFGFLLFQNDITQGIRDLIAALFIIMFCFGLPKLNDRSIDSIFIILCVAGYSFIFRDLFMVREHLQDLGTRKLINGQIYLLQDTIVLFAVLYVILRLSWQIKQRNVIFILIYLILLGLGQLAFLAQGLRFNLIITSVYFGYVLIKSQGIYSKTFAVCLLILVFHFVQKNIALFDFVIEKFITLGANGKVEEFKEVFLYVFDNWNVLLFGKGFGGEFLSPTYGSEINFTHSLFSYLVLKIGFLGCFYGILVYSLWIYYSLRSLIYQNESLQILLLTLAPPFLTQPTYKSFGFGIIIWLAITMIRQQKNRAYAERIDRNINVQ